MKQENDELELIKDRVCPRCGKARPAFDFYQDKNRKSGFFPWCKQCFKEWKKARSGFSMREVLLDHLLLTLPPKYTHPSASHFSSSTRNLADSLVMQGKPVRVISHTANKVWNWREWSTPLYSDITRFMIEEKELFDDGSLPEE